MNILNYMVVAIMAVAGYFLHDPLVGPKGVFRDLAFQAPPKESVPQGNASPKDNGADPVDKPLTDIDPEVANNGTGNDTAEGNPNTEPKPEDDNNSFSLDKILPEDYPEFCEMVRSGYASIPGGKIPLDIGDQLEPLALKEAQLKVRIRKLGVTGTLPVAVTDFVKLTLPKTMARLSGKSRPPVAENDPKPFPEPEQNNDNGTDNGSPVVNVPDPQPEPQPKPTPKPVVRLSEGEIKSLMQQSYRSLSVLQGAEMKGFSIGPIEAYGSKNYQTGIITFEKDTLLGVRELGVKALIGDGKIYKWVWSKSGQDIR